jgi:hypothetical protein
MPTLPSGPSPTGKSAIARIAHAEGLRGQGCSTTQTQATGKACGAFGKNGSFEPSGAEPRLVQQILSKGVDGVGMDTSPCVCQVARTWNLGRTRACIGCLRKRRCLLARCMCREVAGSVGIRQSLRAGCRADDRDTAAWRG